MPKVVADHHRTVTARQGGVEARDASFVHDYNKLLRTRLGPLPAKDVEEYMARG